MKISDIRHILLLVLLKQGIAFFSSSEPEVPVITADVGTNLTLRCGKNPVHDPVLWMHDGRAIDFVRRTKVQDDGSLYFPELVQADSGEYQCSIEDDREDASGLEDDIDAGIIDAKYRLRVRTAPPSLHNVSVTPSTVLALLAWEVADDGGYPLMGFHVRYALINANDMRWHIVQPEHIEPHVRQIDVYRLQANSTYVFEIWASNQLGPGESTRVEATTHDDAIEIELAHHLLEGAENFDTRIWVAAVSVVMGTLVVLGMGTCYVLYKECKTTEIYDEHETIELVPNIILNPGYDVTTVGHGEPDENSNDQTPLRINNNTVVQPVRV